MTSVSLSKPKVTDLNPFLICVLCKGYYIDATTIVECLHSFCKTCIVKYLKRHKYCPICDVLVYKNKPLQNIRPDTRLQNVVYKLIPGLFENEMQRRKNFYSSLSNTKPVETLTSEDAGIITQDTEIILPEENISIALEYLAPSITDGNKGVYGRRYLRCKASAKVSILHKFLKNKYSLSNKHAVEIVCNNEMVRGDVSIMDVAYIYQWKKKTPMYLAYRILEPKVKRLGLQLENDNVKRLKLNSDTSQSLQQLSPCVTSLSNPQSLSPLPPCVTSLSNPVVLTSASTFTLPTPTTDSSPLNLNILQQNTIAPLSKPCPTPVRSNSTHTLGGLQTNRTPELSSHGTAVQVANNNEWNEVELKISDNGEMSATVLKPSLVAPLLTKPHPPVGAENQCVVAPVVTTLHQNLVTTISSVVAQQCKPPLKTSCPNAQSVPKVEYPFVNSTPQHSQAETSNKSLLSCSTYSQPTATSQPNFPNVQGNRAFVHPMIHENRPPPSNLSFTNPNLKISPITSVAAGAGFVPKTSRSRATSSVPKYRTPKSSIRQWNSGVSSRHKVTPVLTNSVPSTKPEENFAKVYKARNPGPRFMNNSTNVTKPSPYQLTPLQNIHKPRTSSEPIIKIDPNTLSPIVPVSTSVKLPDSPTYMSSSPPIDKQKLGRPSQMKDFNPFLHPSFFYPGFIPYNNDNNPLIPNSHPDLMKAMSALYQQNPAFHSSLPPSISTLFNPHVPPGRPAQNDKKLSSPPISVSPARSLAPQPMSPSRSQSQPMSPSKSQTQQPMSPSKAQSQPISPSRPQSQPMSPSKSQPQPMSPSRPQAQPMSPSRLQSQPMSPSRLQSQPMSPSRLQSQPMSPSRSQSQPMSPSNSNLKSQTQSMPISKSCAQITPSSSSADLSRPNTNSIYSFSTLPSLLNHNNLPPMNKPHIPLVNIALSKASSVSKTYSLVRPSSSNAAGIPLSTSAVGKSAASSSGNTVNIFSPANMVTSKTFTTSIDLSTSSSSLPVCTSQSSLRLVRPVSSTPPSTNSSSSISFANTRPSSTLTSSVSTVCSPIVTATISSASNSNGTNNNHNTLAVRETGPPGVDSVKAGMITLEKKCDTDSNVNAESKCTENSAIVNKSLEVSTDSLAEGADKVKISNNSSTTADTENHKPDGLTNGENNNNLKLTSVTN